MDSHERGQRIGKTVLVTGASGGIGMATALGLSERANAAITGRNRERDLAAARTIRSAGGLPPGLGHRELLRGGQLDACPSEWEVCQPSSQAVREGRFRRRPGSAVDNLLLNAAIEVAAALTRILLNNPRFPKLFRGLKCPGCLARESSGELSRQQIGLRDGCQWLGQAPRGPSCHRPMAYLLHADTAPRHESP